MSTTQTFTVAKLRSAAQAIYLATEAVVADEVSAMLRQAARDREALDVLRAALATAERERDEAVKANADWLRDITEEIAEAARLRKALEDCLSIPRSLLHPNTQAVLDQLRVDKESA
jgi:hypothetical protein